MLSTWSNCDAVKQIALRCWIRWWPRSPDGSVEDGWTFAAAHEWNLANPVGDQHGQVMTPWMTELVIIGDVNVMQRELTGLGAGIWLWRRTMHIVAVCAVFFCCRCFLFFCLFVYLYAMFHVLRSKSYQCHRLVISSQANSSMGPQPFCKSYCVSILFGSK